MEDKDTIIREQAELIVVLYAKLDEQQLFIQKQDLMLQEQSRQLDKQNLVIEQLIGVVNDLIADNQNLMSEVQDLKLELAEYKNPKNSGNSSLPPSHDIVPVKRNQSLRKKSGKKSGGQMGHPGNTLLMTETPDEIITHLPKICGCCGHSLLDCQPLLISKRQVVDIPPIVPVVTQHEVYAKKCLCGHQTQALFPCGVSAPVHYGPCLEGLTAYLNVRQQLPFARMKELYKNLFSIDISEGSIQNMLLRVQARFKPVYNKIKSEISEAAVVGTDETGARINGKKAWIWVWQNKENTFLHVSSNRGKQTIKDVFPEGLPKAILVSDALAAQLSTEARGHQLCHAHMSREINYFMEVNPDNEWVLKLKNIFQAASELKDYFILKDKLDPGKTRKIESLFSTLLTDPPDTKGSKLFAFYKRLLKHKDSVFQFLHNMEVPPDNNQSEQSIRNVKVKQKVSGQFKNFEGAQIFVVLRSVIDTLIKRKQNIFQYFQNNQEMVPE